MAWYDYGGLVYKNNELIESACNNYPWHIQLELDGFEILVLKDCQPNILFEGKDKEVNFKSLNPKRTTFTGIPALRLNIADYTIWYFEGRERTYNNKVTKVVVKHGNDWWNCESGYGLLTPEELKKSEWNEIVSRIEDDVMSSEMY